MQIFLIFLRLGLTSFGGPITHLGYFREAFVARLKWLDDAAYADLVALCQFLPGPASSQVGAAIGLMRGGLPGLLAAFIGFTLPSALLMAGAAYGLAVYGEGLDGGLLAGLKLVAVAVVADALWSMARNLAPDRSRATMAVAAAVAMLVMPVVVPGGFVYAQIAVILAGALAGLAILKAEDGEGGSAFQVPIGWGVAGTALVLFAVLLVGLPFLAAAIDNPFVNVVEAFYRSGALVFGGGHVVLPLLQAEVTGPGWIEPEAFISGYGAAQAVPGPLFTFAAFLGGAMDATGDGVADGWVMALVALVAIFLPGLLLVVGALPIWAGLRQIRRLRAALMGVNAAVVGLLAAALYNPVFTASVTGPSEAAFALTAFLLLRFWSVPPWLLVIAAAGLGMLLLG